MSGQTHHDNYPSLEDVLDEDSDAVLNKLKTDWIRMIDGFNRATRDGPLKFGCPLGFVDAVKPEEEGAWFVSVSC